MNRRKRLKKSKTQRRIAKVVNLFLSIRANRKIGSFYRLRRIPKKKKIKSFSLFFSPTASKKKDDHVFFSAFVGKKNATKRNRLRRKMLRAQNHVRRCAQPASLRLWRKTTIWTQMLRQRNRGTSNKCPGVQQRFLQGTLNTSGGHIRKLAIARNHNLNIAKTILAQCDSVDTTIRKWRLLFTGVYSGGTMSD